MKVHALTGSRWLFEEKSVNVKDKAGVETGEKKIRQQLSVELKYPVIVDGKTVREADGSPKLESTYSFIPIENGVAQLRQSKRANSFDALQSISDILVEGKFSLSIQKGQKSTTASIIGAEIDPDLDPSILVLGGFASDSIWYDSQSSRKRTPGCPSNGTVFRYCQVFRDEPDMNDPTKNHRVVTEVQFAALLDDGEKVCYHLMKQGPDGHRRKTVNIIENQGGKLRQFTLSFSQWKELYGDSRYAAQPAKDQAAPRD